MAESFHARVRSTFDQAIDRSGPQRSAYLDQACAGAAELRSRVEALLAAAEKDDSFLSGVAHEGLYPTLTHGHARDGFVDVQVGTTVGPYTLVKLIGEGGFGSVFLAEQVAPVRRQVAIKIIKAGMDTRQVIARFEAERQALALMDHPSIARVLEAGATEKGRPYFVMELVSGEAVTRFCDRQRLTIRQRLELFREICGAVQHAHQKGVIHRDLKPSNILASAADGKPLVKVIDFGIAKAIEGRLSDHTLTEVHQIIGTPEYMSPEQADKAGSGVDTRSDLYSLGALLYELLTGFTPFDRRRLEDSNHEGMRRIIRSEEPPRPSFRLQTLNNCCADAKLARSGPPVAAETNSSILEIADRRGVEPTGLLRMLRRDLDWIVLKCLEKDRARRYDTAAALADDVGHYLAHEPVLARPPSSGYKLRKFVRRNRIAVTTGAAVTAALLVATGISIAFGISEARQRAAAEKSRSEVEEVASFQTEQFAGVDAETMGARLRAELLGRVAAARGRDGSPAKEIDARLAELEKLIAGSDFTGMALATLEQTFFRPALAAIDARFADQPLVKARLLQSVASTLHELGLDAAAADPQERALAIRRAALGENALDTLESLSGKGALLEAQRQLPQAEACYREALEKRRRILGDEHPDTLASISDMAGLLSLEGKLDLAEQLYRDALEGRRRVLGDSHPDTLRSHRLLGVLCRARDKLPEAELHCRFALEQSRQAFGPAHPETLDAIQSMSQVLESQGNLAGAEAYCREALDMGFKVLGEDHPRMLAWSYRVGKLLWAQGRPAEAERYVRKAVDAGRRLLTEQASMSYISALGSLLEEQDKFDEAEVYYVEALGKYRRVLGEEHPGTLASLTSVGGVLQAQGRSAEALALLAPAEPVARRVFARDNAVRNGRFHPGLAEDRAARLARLLTALGRAQAALGDLEVAESNLNEAHGILTEASGVAVTRRDRIQVLRGMVELYDARHAAEPNGGHDATAARWHILLDAAQAPAAAVSPGEPGSGTAGDGT